MTAGLQQGREVVTLILQPTSHRGDEDDHSDQGTWEHYRACAARRDTAGVRTALQHLDPRQTWTRVVDGLTF